MPLPPDTLAEQVAYNVSGDVACTENWPAIRDAILKRAQEAVEAEREACAVFVEKYDDEFAQFCAELARALRARAAVNN